MISPVWNSKKKTFRVHVFAGSFRRPQSGPRFCGQMMLWTIFCGRNVDALAGPRWSQKCVFFLVLWVNFVVSFWSLWRGLCSDLALGSSRTASQTSSTQMEAPRPTSSPLFHAIRNGGTCGQRRHAVRQNVIRTGPRHCAAHTSCGRCEPAYVIFLLNPLMQIVFGHVLLGIMFSSTPP